MDQHLNSFSQNLPAIKVKNQCEEYEERERKEKVEIATLIVNVLEENLKRQRLYRDPVTRNSIFLEKLLCILDGFKAATSTYCTELPEDLQKRMENVLGLLNTNITSLIEMIQQPCYSPDHPYGENMMNMAKSDFETNSESKI